MPRTGKQPGNHRNERSKEQIADEVDGLFKLSLADFTSARNRLASQLKKAGKSNDANLVKALAKPSVSAWAVNQLYWHHRDEFDELIEASARLQNLQTSGLSGKVSNMRGSLDARREALLRLSDIAVAVLSEAGHGASPDTIHRITTTLEAISSSTTITDGQTPGRLTHDVDPPGFDSLASLLAGAMTKRTEPQQREMSTPKQRSIVVRASTQRDDQKQRKLEEARQTKIATTKLAVQSAKKLITETRGKVERLESTYKKLQVDAKEVEKQRREAEAQLKRIRAESEAAFQRARDIAEELARAKKTFEEARRSLEKESKELEALFKG